jgi:hypothetical protein
MHRRRDPGRFTHRRGLRPGPDRGATEAFIRNSAVDAAGELSLTAVNEAQLDAEITTESVSLSAALMDTSSKSGGLMLATNKVNSAARAYIEDAPSVDAGGHHGLCH